MDIIAVLEEGFTQGSLYGLGQFIKVKDVKNLRDAVKLLIDEKVLKDLVNEGAFKEAFLTETAK